MNDFPYILKIFADLSVVDGKIKNYTKLLNYSSEP